MPNVAASALPVVSAKANIASVLVVDTSNNPSLAAPALIGGSGSGGVSTLVLSRNPTAADDGSAGYVVGQFALNTVTGRAFIARSVTTGAAVWVPLGLSRNKGYVSGNSYLPGGTKIAANGTSIVPSTAGRILFIAGEIAERVTIQNFLLSVSTGVASSLAQVAVYNIDPTTKRPIGAPLGSTADIDTSTSSTTVPKVAAPVSTLTLEPGLYAFAFNTNQASGSTYRAFDVADGQGQTVWGSPGQQDVFGTLTGVYFAGTNGTWPNFASNATFSPSYGAVPTIGFVAGTPT